MANRPNQPQVAIILLNWNSRLDTLECLEAVYRLDYPNFRVVLCDNDSKDSSLECVQQWANGQVAVQPASNHFAASFKTPRQKQVLSCARYTRHEAESAHLQTADAELVLIETGGNLGFAGGNNVGIRFAMQHWQPDYVWLLNTDTLVDPHALTGLVARAEKSDATGMVGSSLVYYWKPAQVQALGGASLNRLNTRMQHVGDGSLTSDIPADGKQVETQLAYIVGASMLVSRRFIERVGLMCEDYFLYYEEIDWAMRANGQFELGYAPASLVFHKVGGASQKVASTASLRFMWRNRIRFVARFLPASLPGTLFVTLLDLARTLLRRQFVVAGVIANTLLNSPKLITQGKSNSPWARP